MTPIYIKVDSLPLKIVPDVKMMMDSHPILTYKYYLFRDVEAIAEITEAERLMNQQLTAENGNYFGYIIFDKPGQIFTYTSNEKHELLTEEVEQIIEQLTYYRDHPELWKEN
ncbi:hypothetical protein GCM10027037_32890 [Mucilaginibacter koreensis]